MGAEEPERYEIIWRHADPGYLDPSSGRLPRGPIEVTRSNEESLRIVRDYFAAHWRSACRELLGDLRHPFFIPGGVYTTFWANDAFMTACAVPDEALPWAKGSVLNLLDGIRADGRPAKNAGFAGENNYKDYPGPVCAQFAFIVGRRLGDFSWIEPYWPRLERTRKWYEAETADPRGYFVSLDAHGSVFDNNPSVYGRPPGTSAGIDLAAWHYREYRAMERLSVELNKPGAEGYRRKADDLKERVRRRYWDTVDRFFYNIDCCIDDERPGAQAITWIVHLKFRSFASCLPLWANLAREDQAAAVVERMMSKREFLSPCGIRSHSAAEPIYNNLAMGGPSNFQGPVWGVSTFLGGYALARYGFRDQALEACYRLIRTFAADIEQNGCVHEYYHADTCQPVLKPGHFGWNALASRVIDDIEQGTDCTTLDLLD